jgi:hypothetical protein
VLPVNKMGKRGVGGRVNENKHNSNTREDRNIRNESHKEQSRTYLGEDRKTETRA